MSEFLFMQFGLRRGLVRRAPAAPNNVGQLRRRPVVLFDITVELRSDGLRYIKPVAFA